MALPSNVDHGTVTGYFEDALGNVLAGTVTFTPQFSVARDVGATPKTIILPASVVANLTQGAFTAVLVATDDSDLGLSTWNYLVTFKFTGANAPSMQSFNMFVPMNTTTDLATAITVSSSTGVQITKGDKGDPGTPGVMQSIVAGSGNVSIDATDPANPVITVSGTGGTPGGTGDLLLNSDTQSEAWTALGTVPEGNLPTLGGATGSDLLAADDEATAWGVLGSVPVANLPAIALSQWQPSANQAARLALTAQPGDWTTQADTSATYILVGTDPTVNSNWTQITTALPTATTGTAGIVPLATTAQATAATDTTHAVTPAGLAVAPVSTAQQGALDAKADLSSGHVPVAQASIGITLTLVSTTTWPSRPTSDNTNVHVRWVDAGALGTQPSGALDGDSLLAAS